MRETGKRETGKWMSRKEKSDKMRQIGQNEIAKRIIWREVEGVQALKRLG